MNLVFTPLFKGRKLLFPFPSISKQDVEFLKELAESGKFKPLIDRTYPLNQIVDAYKYVESGKKIGNVILKVSNLKFYLIRFHDLKVRTVN